MSLLCHDCGVDTTPCSHRRGCRHAGRHEYFMVTDDVWVAAGGMSERHRVLHLLMSGTGERLVLCVGCLEHRIGRPLVAADFTDAEINDPSPWDTPRLAAAKTAT